MSNQAALALTKTNYKSLNVSVHKFGGSSLKTTEQIQKISDFIRTKTQPGDLLVLSANGKVTDWLVAFSQGQKQYLNIVRDYLSKLAGSLLGEQSTFQQSLEQDLISIENTWPNSSFSYHQLIAHGEIWSVRLLKEVCDKQSIPTQELVPEKLLQLKDSTDNNQFSESYAQQYFSEVYAKLDEQRLLVAGFIAQDDRQKLITLGRNGSDYSATAIAKLVNAKSVTIWTDVDGIYSADPNLVSDAIRLDSLSFCEAQALSELGANVLHQKTVTPLLGSDLTTYIKSSLVDNSVGTTVSKRVNQEQEVKTITSKSRLKQILVPDISELSARHIQKQLLSKQLASYANSYDRSLHRLTLYVEAEEVFNSISIIKAHQFYPLVSDQSVTLISLVGQNIRQNRKLIGKFLSRLEQYEIQHIHYPSNYHTLCVFVEDKVANDLLVDLHNTFFLFEPSIPIVVLGYGNIGKQFIEILMTHKEAIEQSINKSLSLKAIANSQYYAFNEKCLTQYGHECFVGLQDNRENQLFEVLNDYRDKELVIVDLTASEGISNRYLEFAENQWHIISANKIAASSFEYANKISERLTRHSRRWLTNTTVGAGLPVQTSIEKLKESGDEITQISGIFSGSLSWLFAQYDGTVPFSQLLKEAKDNAYTEPDPREDLSGNDVIRKIRILAKEVDFVHAREDFSPAIEPGFLTGTLDDFWQKEEQIDEYFLQLYQKAQQQNAILRYVATLDKGQLQLKLTLLGKNHAFANLNPCDNVFSIRSNWYADNPLIIQGPGAGREVTAAGVLNDLCDLLRRAQ